MLTSAKQLSSKRRATVSQFKNMCFVNIREYYDDKASGELKPGKKVRPSEINASSDLIRTNF